MLPEEVSVIARNAANKINFGIGEHALDIIKKYSTNGREAVNIIQIAAGLALNDGEKEIRPSHIEWVVNSGQYTPRPEKKIPDKPQVGLVNGLAVYGPNMGTLIELEANVIPAASGKGNITITGVVEEEEIGGRDGKKYAAKAWQKVQWKMY